MPKDGRFRRAKSRDWTDSEVQEAAAFVRNERPDVWQKLLDVERTAGDYHGVEEKNTEWRLLHQLHPECELNELTDMFLKLRKLRMAIIANGGI